MSKGKKPTKSPSEVRTLYHELDDRVPKLLRILVQVGLLNPAQLVLWLTIVDRFNVSREREKECFDPIPMIGNRCGRKKHCVGENADVLVGLRLLANKYRVFEKGKIRDFPCFAEANSFLRSLIKEGRSVQREPIRVFFPVEKMPTLEELGIVCRDESNRLYEYIGEKNLKTKEKNPDTSEETPPFRGKSSSLIKEKFSSRERKIDHNVTNENGTKCLSGCLRMT